MTTITQSISSLGSVPTTSDPSTFDSRADTFLGTTLPGLRTEINTWAGQCNTVAGEVNTNATNAAASATAADASSTASLWVSGGPFTAGQVRYSPTTYQSYRCIQNNSGTTDPQSDTTNWTKISSGGSPRISSATTDTTPLAWNSDSYDMTILTAQAEAFTVSADAGSPVHGQKHLFRFKDNGTPRAITWTTGSSKAFRAIGVTLPTTTITSKIVYIGCVYNSTDSRWDVIAVGQET